MSFTRVLSGFKPTGSLQLGNYLGAIRPLVRAQERTDTVVMVVDLHALTVDHEPAALRARTREVATVLLAAGVDPNRSTLYVQSGVPEHAGLHYLLECTVGYGEARRMIQFKEKSAGQRQVRLSLLTYPVLMVGDILLHDTDEVPVGKDQSQHVELTRAAATRFNARYGPTFVVPRAVNPPVAARIRDLSDPATKMGKSHGGPGVVFLLDPPDVIRRKVLRAVTDARSEPCHDPDRQPGVSNLLEILAACTGGSPAALAGAFRGYGELKAAVVDALVDELRPLRAAYAELSADPAEVDRVLRAGARRARVRAAATLDRAREAIGLLAA